MYRIICILFVFSLLLTSCRQQPKMESVKAVDGEMKKLILKSSAFNDGDILPVKYTCDGEGINPPLQWESVPADTASFVIICEDPDAPGGTFTHWMIYNIPADSRNIQENLPLKPELRNGSLQGKNDFSKTGYGAPCPPGGTHRYNFMIFALDNMLSIDSGVKRNTLDKAMTNHIIGEGLLKSQYSAK